MDVETWKAVRQSIERYQTEGAYSPFRDRTILGLALGNASSGVAKEVFDHLMAYAEARDQIAASPEARLMRVFPWIPLAGMVVVVLGNFKYGMKGYCLSTALLAIVPLASCSYRFKEQFETMRREISLALWKANHQEHGAPVAVTSIDPSKPASIDYFKSQLEDLFTSSAENMTKLDALRNQLSDSRSKTALISALGSFVNAREIIVHRARTTFAPCFGGAVLFGALALAGEYAGHSGPSYLGRASFACGVGAVVSVVYMEWSTPIQAARQSMKEKLNEAMAYMPEPQGV